MEWIQTILLIILVDRNLILRDRYKIAIENTKLSDHRYFAIWIYCKAKGDDRYWRSGGRRLLYFTYNKKKFKE